MTLMLKKLTESGKLSKDEKAPRYKLGEALKKTPAKKKVAPKKVRVRSPSAPPAPVAPTSAAHSLARSPAEAGREEAGG